MENRNYLESFINTIRIWSYGIQNGEFPKEMNVDIFMEIVQNSIMALRDGAHFYIRDIKKIFQKSMPSEVYEIPYDIFTISYKTEFYDGDSESKNDQAHTLVIRKLSDLVYSIVIWVSENLDLWQPLPLYSVLSMENVQLKKPLAYSYWAQKCYYDKSSYGEFSEMLYQVAFEDLSKEDIIYINNTWIYSILFQLFFGFWNKHPSFKTKKGSIYYRTMMVDEEGDDFSLNWTKYREIL